MYAQVKLSGSIGFTLAELLIALAILGLIATFSIPKILQAQQDQRYSAGAKEAMAMISGAYQAYCLAQTPASTMLPGDLSQYMNYVSIDTASDYDFAYTYGTGTCDSTSPCLKLHSGALLNFGNWAEFGGTASTNAITFFYDPDGTTDGTTNGPGKSLQIWLYYNGRIATKATANDNTMSGGTGPHPAEGGTDPPWFSWN